MWRPRSRWLITIGQCLSEGTRSRFCLTDGSRELYVQILEKAHGLAPHNLITKQFLAEALYSQNQSAQAISLLKEILATTETAEGIAEDADTKNEAKSLLAEWEKK